MPCLDGFLWPLCNDVYSDAGAFHRRDLDADVLISSCQLPQQDACSYENACVLEGAGKIAPLCGLYSLCTRVGVFFIISGRSKQPLYPMTMEIRPYILLTPSKGQRIDMTYLLGR